MPPAPARIRWRLRIRGTVQGVGFRPTVWRHATAEKLGGWVRNTGSDVLIEVEGEEARLIRFLDRLKTAPPPLSRINDISRETIPASGDAAFVIETSTGEATLRHIAPDIASCDECIEEIRSAEERRHRYPFTNCTNCGPRYTIIRDLPYDRPKTTMAAFSLCDDCRREYESPADRRYHAQPVACPVCGPHVECRKDDAIQHGEAGIDLAVETLKAGGIVAVKGLGGYHLACLALDNKAVSLLRQRKGRASKPFAVMVPDMAWAEKLACLTGADRALLSGCEKPIVLVPMKPDGEIPEGLAPGMRQIGLFLPYTPLHAILLDQVGEPLVMTSGNFSDSPIVYKNDEADRRLSQLADARLHHNRPIQRRCEDSVAAVSAGRPMLFRRARGYAPSPLRVDQKSGRTVLALGPHLKNTFCFLKKGMAFLSPHEGDLHHAAAYDQFKVDVADFTRLLDMAPQAVALDLHPDYATTRYAAALPGAMPRIPVQHHHAHIASCLAENGRDETVIGVAFDGLGMGPDGQLWGGEFLLADMRRYERAGFIEPVLMPGGEQAARQTWRIALACLQGIFGREKLNDFSDLFGDHPWEGVAELVQRDINCPPISSAGRLFDLAAALSGVCLESHYEGDAAIRLEQQVNPSDESAPYDLPIQSTSPPFILSWRPLVEAMLEDRKNKVSPDIMAARFHSGLAHSTCRLCEILREQYNRSTVALSGGVFHNRVLTQLVTAQLEAGGFTVLRHSQVPAGDGGISLGQAVIADRMLQDQ